MPGDVTPALNIPPSGLEKAADWYLRLMTMEIPMPWDWPVEVNYHEAKAFCNWKAAVSRPTVQIAH